jgi:hypothetical protein
MRQIADRDHRDLVEVVGAEDLHLVQSADRDVGEGAVGIVGEVDVVGDRTGVERLEELERRPGGEHLGLPYVLQREPDLAAVRRRGDVGAERAFLLHTPDGLMVGD